MKSRIDFLFISWIAMLLIFVPAGLWKMIDIAMWMFSHVHLTIK